MYEPAGTVVPSEKVMSFMALRGKLAKIGLTTRKNVAIRY